MADSTPSDALQRLAAGNARFVAGASRARSFAPSAAAASGNRPFAVVLGCSDARVPVEIVFDEGPGSLFVVRVAGNFVTGAGLGSIEYAIASLGAQLIVVLGHEDCGAVSAALAYVADGATFPGSIHELAHTIAPAVRESRNAPGDWYGNAIARNVELNVKALAASAIVSEAVDRGALRVTGGIYSVRTGRVAFS